MVKVCSIKITLAEILILVFWLELNSCPMFDSCLKSKTGAEEEKCFDHRIIVYMYKLFNTRVWSLENLPFFDQIYQLVCIPPAEILNLVVIWIFITVCLHWSWKAPVGSGQLRITVLFPIYMKTYTTSSSLLGRTFFLSFPRGPITLSKMCFPTCESTALSGSSNKYTSASKYIARARLIRCFWPPLRFIP